MSDYKRDVERAFDIRSEILHEIKNGKLSRRALYKKMLLGGGALAVLSALRGGNSAHAAIPSTSGTGRGNDGIAPRTDPFTQPLNHLNDFNPYTGVYNVIQPGALTPGPSKTCNTYSGGTPECYRPAHQGWDACWATYEGRRKEYMLVQRAFKGKIDPRLPEQDVWGFDGIQRGVADGRLPLYTQSPGPTFHSYYNEPCIVRIRNDLPLMGQFKGHGCSETSTHLHNAHTPFESDGNPDEYFPRNNERSGNNPANWRDFHYPMEYAGGDHDNVSEALGTLWYHDHRHDFTAPNVYRGLAGFHLLFDRLDANRDMDTTNGALGLPAGKYDVPLMVTDKFVNSNGLIFFDQFNFDGIIGNKYVVNGNVQPRFEVERRPYRLRILNPGVSRTYGFSLMTSDDDKGLKNAKFVPDGSVWVIGTGGNLLPERLAFKNGVPLGASQRLDLWVDFARIDPEGRKKFVFLVNRFYQENGRMPEGYLGSGPDGVQFEKMTPGDPVMLFDMNGSKPQGFAPECPVTLRPLPWDPNDALGKLGEDRIIEAIGKSNPFPNITDKNGRPVVERVREWKFDRFNGQWSVNGRLYDPDRVDAKVGLNTGEIWIIQGAGSWVHPIHLHYEEHRTLWRDGKRPKVPDAKAGVPGDLESGRDDTMTIGAGERGILFRQFRDWKGKYVMHCHNVVHEDHAMMVRFDVE